MVMVLKYLICAVSVIMIRLAGIQRLPVERLLQEALQLGKTSGLLLVQLSIILHILAMEAM